MIRCHESHDRNNLIEPASTVTPEQIDLAVPWKLGVRSEVHLSRKEVFSSRLYNVQALMSRYERDDWTSQ